MSCPLDKAHNSLGSAESFFGVVSDVQLIQHVSKTHNSQTNTTIATESLVDFFYREISDIDNIIKHMNSNLSDLSQTVIINFAIDNKLLEVDRTEITNVPIMEELFTARITGFDTAQFRYGIGTIYFVQEDNTGFTIVPSGSHEFVQKFSSSDGFFFDIANGEMTASINTSWFHFDPLILTHPWFLGITLHLLHKFISKSY